MGVTIFSGHGSGGAAGKEELCSRGEADIQSFMQKAAPGNSSDNVLEQCMCT